MRQVRSLLGMTCAAALLTVATAVPATAQTYERVTKLTFDAPVELPTMVLPAGTYTFRLSDPDSDRHVIEVLDENGATLVTRLHAMPTSRSEASEVTVVTFGETAADAPPPVRYWYYPNDRMGQEFAYPKDRAQAIAQATGESVLSMDGEEIARVEPAPVAAPVEPAPVEPAPVTEPAPTPVEPTPTEPMVSTEPAPVTPVEPMPTAQADTQAVGTSGELPDTASELPLVGLIGVLALAAFVSLRAFRRRTV